MTNPLAIYIHWPFCLSKCPYCDFNSHVRESVDQHAWRDALVNELSFYAEKTQKNTIFSIFFGGGTPSLMPPQTVETILNSINQLWKVDADCEVTLEANPTSSEINKFRAFRSAGINRVSLGVQALDSEVLRFLGRTHSAEHALQAVEMAAETFPRFSFDLIYARPDQTLKNWERELRHALHYAGDHLSLYQLTIEPGTAFFHRAARGDLREIDEAEAAELYELTQEIMGAHGLPAYEISNHARLGAESRHNLTYWRYGDYLGIGPGAHGRWGGRALLNWRSPEKWLESVQLQGNGQESDITLSTQEQMQERLLMGMRLAEGIAREDVEPILNPASLLRLQAAGLLEVSAERLHVLPKGRLLLNRILTEMVQDLPV